MNRRYANNARGIMSQGVIATDQIIYIEEGGENFPYVDGSGDNFALILQDSDGNIEVCDCFLHTDDEPNVFRNVLRGGQGTVARAFAAGSIAANRLTAADMTSIQADLTAHADTFVAKQAGYSLTKNNFTDALKDKLDGIAANANNFSLPAGSGGQVLKHNGTSWVASTDDNTTYSGMSAAIANAGTDAGDYLISAAVLKGAINANQPFSNPNTWTGLQNFTGGLKVGGVDWMEEGENSSGRWVRFANGLQICYANVTGSAGSFTASGSLFSLSFSDAISWPVAFTSLIAISVDKGVPAGGYFWTTVNTAANTYLLGITLWRVTALSPYTPSLSVIGIGRWK